MSDRVPIGTHPGSISGLIDQDLIVAPPAVASYSVDSLFLRTTDDTTDDLVASIRNATGGGGDGLACTIADGEESGVSSGSAITVDVDESLYIRVTAGNALRMNLSGWFQIEGPPGVTALLTSLLRVKTYWGISGTDDDTLIYSLILEVSGRIQNWVGDDILQTTATAEKHTLPLGDHILQLNHRPIVSIASITEAGTALVEDTDFECGEAEKKLGQVIRISGGYPASWNTGERRISATYDHGFATVPEEIAEAATRLATSRYLLTKPGGGRLALRGSSHDPGGAGEYMAPEEVWQEMLPQLVPFKRM